jgi:cytochrome c oxidase cbb3-type subunit 4
MRSIINSLENLAGLSIYPMLSLLVFFIFFGIVGLWIITANKQKMEKMRNLPLEDDTPRNEA